MKRDRTHLQQQAQATEGRGVGRSTASLPLADHTPTADKRVKREPEASPETSAPASSSPTSSASSSAVDGGDPIPHDLPPYPPSAPGGRPPHLSIVAHPPTYVPPLNAKNAIQNQAAAPGGQAGMPATVAPHPATGGLRGSGAMAPSPPSADHTNPSSSSLLPATTGMCLPLSAISHMPHSIYGPSEVLSASYRGEHKDDKPHGRGYKIWVDGDWYEGEWRMGKQHGRGVYCCPSGRRYEGEWKDGIKHGRGIKTWANGDRYEGEWKDGKQHGKGVYTWANGDRYEGEWKDGNLHGKGIKTWWNDNRYEGEWRDDVKHGYGTKTWANGDRYEGQWRDGTKHGRGTYTWANGDSYIGEWKDDKKHGKGVFCFANGRKKEGTWENDLKNGAFTFTDERGKVFLQIYEEGKLLSSTLKHDVSSSTPTFSQFVASAQHWFTVFEENQKQLDEKTLELEQLRIQNAGRENLEQELRARIKELQVKLRMVQDENARLIGGGSENCSLEELQVLERTLERSRTLVSTRISILNSRTALAEKSRCMQCAERSKEVVFVPCGHRTLCQICAGPAIMCPVCETPITSKVISYDS